MVRFTGSVWRCPPRSYVRAQGLRALHHPAPLRQEARTQAAGDPEKLPIGNSAGEEEEANFKEAQNA